MPYAKINLKCIMDPNIKAKTINFKKKACIKNHFPGVGKIS